MSRAVFHFNDVFMSHCTYTTLKLHIGFYPQCSEHKASKLLILRSVEAAVGF